MRRNNDFVSDRNKMKGRPLRRDGFSFWDELGLLLFEFASLPQYINTYQHAVPLNAILYQIDPHNIQPIAQSNPKLMINPIGRGRWCADM